MSRRVRRSAVGERVAWVWWCHTDDMAVVGTRVRNLIRIVADDPGLPRSARKDAAALMDLAMTRPRLAEQRLGELRESVLPTLELEPPRVDYARCIPIETFWRHHLDRDRKAMFGRDPEAYARHLEVHSDPAAAARGDLSDDPILFRAPHSWLIPSANVAGVVGHTLARRLQLGDSKPPYVVFVFPCELLRAAGVTVREPRGIDAVPGPFLQWTPGGVPDERIDRDVPLSALGWIEWRP